MSKEMLRALTVLEEEKGISKDVVITALEAALVSAYKKNYGQAQNVEVEFDQKKGNMHVYAVKEVVEYVFDSTLEVSLEEAHAKNKAYEVGDKIRFEVTPKDFGRIAAQTAKQVIMQRLRDAERTNIYNEFIQYENEIMTGVVDRQDFRYVYVNLGRIVAGMAKQDQIPTEEYLPDQRIKVLVSKVDNTTKGPQIFVSRTHPDLLKRLFEQEVPEIYDGVVEIVSIAREAGDRTKVAVRSHNPNVDAIGTIVGRGGANIKKITSKFHPARYDAKSDRMIPVEENIDVIEWVADPAEFIYNAIAPAEVDQVIFDENDSKRALVVVPDNKLSLAIGRRGQNVRLAAHLTGYRIDIKSASEFEAMEEAGQVDYAVADELIEE